MSWFQVFIIIAVFFVAFVFAAFAVVWTVRKVCEFIDE